MISRRALKYARRLLERGDWRRNKALVNELLVAGFPVSEAFHRGQPWHAWVETVHEQRFRDLLEAAEAKEKP